MALSQMDADIQHHISPASSRWWYSHAACYTAGPSRLFERVCLHSYGILFQYFLQSGSFRTQTRLPFLGELFASFDDHCLDTPPYKYCTMSMASSSRVSIDFSFRSDRISHCGMARFVCLILSGPNSRVGKGKKLNWPNYTIAFPRCPLSNASRRFWKNGGTSGKRRAAKDQTIFLLWNKGSRGSRFRRESNTIIRLGWLSQVGCVFHTHDENDATGIHEKKNNFKNYYCWFHWVTVTNGQEGCGGGKRPVTSRWGRTDRLTSG